MNEVEAVKTPEEIAAVTALLAKRGRLYADIWKLGLNVALRISDLLELRYDDLDLIRNEVVLTEKKTNKKRTIRLNTPALNVIHTRRSDYNSDLYLFQAHANRSKSMSCPVNRSTVARVFQDVGQQLNIKLGTHSTRKTRGWMMHQAGVSIEQICRVMNHSNPSVTMAYIGLTKEMTLKTYDDFEL